jgi:hypothetical protein
VEAGSSWTQTTELDFLNGSVENLTINPGGSLELGFLSKNIVDNFVDDANISYRKNVAVSTSSAKAALTVINKTFGGNDADYGYCVRETSDGGYILVGELNSYDNGHGDTWLIKTDATGNKEWEKNYGTNIGEKGWSVIETNDEGFAIIGWESAIDGLSSNLLITKTDSQGNKQWEKKYGGQYHDSGWAIKQTSDNGYIVAGRSDVISTHNEDAWLIKTDSSGNKQWDKTFGGTGLDVFYSVDIASDGSFYLFGITESFVPSGNLRDAWLLKTDSFGNELWNKSYGGGDEDLCERGFIASDGGCILLGRTESFSSNTVDDAWVIKTDSSGNELWNKTYGNKQNNFFLAGQQTSDGSYAFFGTDRPLIGYNWKYFWLVKTDSSGNEQWNKTYGSGLETGYHMSLTSDGGYVLTGLTKSYGGSDYDIWLIKVDANGEIKAEGELVSVNLLESKTLFTIDNFECNVTVPSGTTIKVQFSQDNTTWYDSSGILDGWIALNDGLNSIDLSTLSWNTPYFYYHIKFNSSSGQVPELNQINLTYSTYQCGGTFTSIPFDASTNVNWQNLAWTADTPVSTKVGLQFRSASTELELDSIDFVGPDGTPDTFYSTSPVPIQTSHYGDRWCQFKLYLNTTDTKFTPSVQDVGIEYNCIPGIPTLLSPTDDVWLSDNTPIFNWTFNDLDSAYSGFQVLIDDDPGFSDPDYDSTSQTSGNLYWHFPTGTSYTTIPDGIWYWKARTQDSDGDWSDFSEYQILKIDTTLPNEFIPTADPSSWTFDNQPSIYFSTTDDCSGVARYELKVDSDEFELATSPYRLPELSDGIHIVTVRAFDQAGNYQDASVQVYIDTQPPEKFVPAADPSGWTSNTQPQLSFSTTDTVSGIDYYKIKIDSGDFTQQTSPYTIPTLSDGIHTVKVRAYDLAGNYIDGATEVKIDTKPPNSFKPAVEPSGWTSITQPVIEYSTSDSASGMDRYELKIDTGPFSIHTSPYTLSSQSEGVHNITIRAYDVAGNFRDEIADFYIDISPPQIEHVPITSTNENTEITISTNITDKYSGVGDVGLYYKLHDETDYSKISMNGDKNTYTAVIPASDVTADLEYYIAAEDKAVPANIGYYGANGSSSSLPTTSSDINIHVDGSSSNGHPDDNEDMPVEDNGDGEDDTDKTASSRLWIVIIIVVIIIVIIILWLMFIRKKREPTEQAYQPVSTEELAIPPTEPLDQPQAYTPEPATDTPKEIVQPPQPPQPPVAQPVERSSQIRE